VCVCVCVCVLVSTAWRSAKLCVPASASWLMAGYRYSLVCLSFDRVLFPCCPNVSLVFDQCLGSVQHLKAKFGTGFSAEFKLREPSAESIANITARLKRALGGVDTVELQHITKACEAMAMPHRAVEVSSSGSGQSRLALFSSCAVAIVVLMCFHCSCMTTLIWLLHARMFVKD
jgi:hypothetical protein